jgi:CRP/FNR family transcriptional regulator, cyclic AMP receptor protein
MFVESHEGQRLVLNTCGPGELFGEIALLDGRPRTASAVTLEDCELLVINRDDLFGLVGRHPRAAITMLTVVGQRLRSTDEFLRSHVSRNPNVEEDEQMTWTDRLADRVAAFGGSWKFILYFGGLLFVWMAGNAFLLLENAFDPYPFVLLSLVLGMIPSIAATWPGGRRCSRRTSPTHPARAGPGFAKSPIIGELTRSGKNCSSAQCGRPAT